MIELIIGFSLLKDSTDLKLEPSDIEKLFSAMDVNQNGVIDYTEFLAVFMENYIMKNERYLRDFFEKYDKVPLLAIDEIITMFLGWKW